VRAAASRPARQPPEGTGGDTTGPGHEKKGALLGRLFFGLYGFGVYALASLIQAVTAEGERRGKL